MSADQDFEHIEVQNVSVDLLFSLQNNNAGDSSGVGLSRVSLRVLVTFEHELRGLQTEIENSLRNGTLQKILQGKGIRLCIISSTVSALHLSDAHVCL